MLIAYSTPLLRNSLPIICSGVPQRLGTEGGKAKTIFHGAALFYSNPDVFFFARPQ